LLEALSWRVAHELFIVLVYVEEFDELELIELLNVHHNVFSEDREQLLWVKLWVRVQERVKEVYWEAQPYLIKLLLTSRAAKEIIRDDLIKLRRLKLDFE